MAQHGLEPAIGGQLAFPKSQPGRYHSQKQCEFIQLFRSKVWGMGGTDFTARVAEGIGTHTLTGYKERVIHRLHVRKLGKPTKIKM